MTDTGQTADTNQAANTPYSAYLKYQLLQPD